jgi:hypothetical protein
LGRKFRLYQTSLEKTLGETIAPLLTVRVLVVSQIEVTIPDFDLQDPIEVKGNADRTTLLYRSTHHHFTLGKRVPEKTIPFNKNHLMSVTNAALGSND